MKENKIKNKLYLRNLLTKSNAFLFSFFLLIVTLACYHNLQKDRISTIIRSDGSGYYAYLPALFLYSGYEKSYPIEQKYKHQETVDPVYLHPLKNGKYINKYFPGLSFMQLPFFLIACFLSYLFHYPIDGYSSVFQLLFFVGAMTYLFLGLIFIRRILEHLNCYKWYYLFVVFFATSLSYYCIDSISYTHLYSFVTIAAFIDSYLSYQKTSKSIDLAKISFYLTLIVFLRPTNLLVILMLPYFIESKESTIALLKNTLTRKNIMAILAPFFILVIIFLVVTKIQTGSLFSVGYKGEGFNFLDPKILQNLFGFRVGLFVQTPVFFLAIIACLVNLKTRWVNNIFYISYFFSLTYIISSWWCWDYASLFGNRPFTEHSFLLLLPLFQTKKIKPIFILPLISLLTMIGFIRLFSVEMEYITITQFNFDNYLKSLYFFDESNKNRWSNNRTCPPYGAIDHEYTIHLDLALKHFDSTTAFAYDANYTFPKKRKRERIYLRVECDKMIECEDAKDIFIVYDVTGKHGKRFYQVFNFYEDCYEAKGAWKHLVFENYIEDHFENYKEMKVYLWNKNLKNFFVKNYKATVYEYKYLHQ
jgi:hypothetical protein